MNILNRLHNEFIAWSLRAFYRNHHNNTIYEGCDDVQIASFFFFSAQGWPVILQSFYSAFVFDIQIRVWMLPWLSWQIIGCIEKEPKDWQRVTNWAPLRNSISLKPTHVTTWVHWTVSVSGKAFPWQSFSVRQSQTFSREQQVRSVTRAQRSLFRLTLQTCEAGSE